MNSSSACARDKSACNVVQNAGGDHKNESTDQKTSHGATARSDGVAAKETSAGAICSDLAPIPVLAISASGYRSAQPFPHVVIDDFLPEAWASRLQRDIIAVPDADYHVVRTAFEDKLLLPKLKFPESVRHLLTRLESEAFLAQLSALSGRAVYRDEPGHYWGVHKAKSSDRLDVHVDAGIHPIMNKRKFLTFLLYLSNDWEPQFGGELELWKGDSAGLAEPKVDGPAARIEPKFNRAILMTNTDRSWHGSPTRVNCPPTSRRILFTLSYMTDDDPSIWSNKRPRAYFAAPRSDPDAFAQARSVRAAEGSAACVLADKTTVKQSLPFVAPNYPSSLPTPKPPPHHM